MTPAGSGMSEFAEANVASLASKSLPASVIHPPFRCRGRRR